MDKIAEMFAGTLPPTWVTAGIRHRIAGAEYEAASNPLRLIPEQRIADVWNKYVREIGASDEALVNVSENFGCRTLRFLRVRLLTFL